ncbi:LamB/YcsF family protein [Paenibacillus alkalitolerans]|uniref:LamB/YcsF family protein n=1 Tax=Paenibacillus alkalitolerans TaxID=2799335 RepID=UPI0018F70CDC|nr:5-oxoprolinase subunit PxpA [Paenibacillus alkalitolerans]
MKVSIDINCDLGESFGVYRMADDERLLDWVTSANVACGFHAGDPSTMRRAVRACLAKGVAIGAHPGLQDLAGFGRRAMSISSDEAYEIVLYQVGALDAFIRAEGGSLRHIKPHGALYHMAENNPGIAEAIVRAAAAYDDGIAVYGIAHGKLAACADRFGLKAVHEAFADRTYESAGKLTPRSSAHAVIADPQDAAKQALLIAKDRCVITVSGDRIPLQADSICIHGDSSHAAATAEAIHRAFVAAGLKAT